MKEGYYWIKLHNSKWVISEFYANEFWLTGRNRPIIPIEIGKEIIYKNPSKTIKL